MHLAALILSAPLALDVHLAALILSVPVALDGESSSVANSTGIAVISLVSIVSGYLLLAGLWYFVFRDKTRSKRKKRSSGRGD